ncbi:MAG TPA: class I SAM-dependent methyltransferase [Thermoanaerobaculia bacterium]|nr:class I SAM-dependent methyltransferase [Thermoanaerobaculia bacterium]
MGRFIRTWAVLYSTFRRRPARDRIHTLVRFLTCPFLRVIERVPTGSRLLDIGAGHGVLAVLARERGARVTTVEPDARKVRPLPSISAVIGFDDVVRGRFDVITIVDVLYKLPLADWDPLLARCLSRLLPGGVLLIKEQDPTARVKNAWNRAQERGASLLGLTLGEAFSYEAPTAFAARLARHGFTATWKRIDGGYPHPHVLYEGRRAGFPPASGLASRPAD